MWLCWIFLDHSVEYLPTIPEIIIAYPIKCSEAEPASRNLWLVSRSPSPLQGPRESASLGLLEILMERRGFFGSVLGFVVGTQIPFKALAAPAPVEMSRVDRYIKLLHVFKEDSSILMKYRGILHTTDGMIQCPGILSLVRDMKELKWVLTFKEIEMQSSLIVRSLSILDERGNRLLTKEFSSSIDVVATNVLKLTYTLDADMNIS